MSDQPSAPDPPAVLLVKRLTDLADALGSDAAFRTVVLDRLMFLDTGYEDPFN